MTRVCVPQRSRLSVTALDTTQSLTILVKPHRLWWQTILLCNRDSVSSNSNFLELRDLIVIPLPVYSGFQHSPGGVAHCEELCRCVSFVLRERFSSVYSSKIHGPLLRCKSKDKKSSGIWVCHVIAWQRGRAHFVHVAPLRVCPGLANILASSQKVAPCICKRPCRSL